jgi:Lar family restriction alleviation protein
MSELKPCPFCGAIDRHEIEVDERNNSTWIRCLGCGVMLWKWSHSDAVSAWNTRPLEDALEAENQRLRDALKAVLIKANMVQDDLQEEHGYYLECVFMGICAVAEGLLRTEPEEE